MMGKDIWEDIDIDAMVLQQEVHEKAVALIDHYGKDITEVDLLKMNTRSDSAADPINTALVRACLEYYKTQGYNPEWIHADMAGKASTKKKWWKFWK